MTGYDLVMFAGDAKLTSGEKWTRENTQGWAATSEGTTQVVGEVLHKPYKTQESCMQSPAPWKKEPPAMTQAAA